MADLVTLMSIDIPEGRNSLLESQTNLEKVPSLNTNLLLNV